MLAGCREPGEPAYGDQVGRGNVAGAVRLWAHSEIRRRWPSLVLLGVLAGLAAGLAMAAIDGAQRTETAYRRMRAQLFGADAVFFPSQVGISDADVSKLSQIPEVVAWGGFTSTPAQFDEFPGQGGPLVQVGSDWLTTIERAKVIAGRLPDPARDDEAVINVPVEKVGGRVGMTLTWRSLSPADVKALGGYPPDGWDWTKATGPVTKLRIVGVVRQPMESVLSFASTPVVWASSTWAREHLASSAVDFNNAVVRLRHGASDVAAFEAAVARVYGRDDIPVKDLSDDIKRVQRSLDLERAALLLFAAAVIVASVVLLGQAFVRSVRAGSEGAPALRALGLGRRDLMAGLMGPHVLTIAIAAATAPATAAALSTRFPIGLGRRLDPALGFHVDGGALAVGVAITVVALGAVCGLVAWLTVRRVSSPRRAPRPQLVGVATRVGASVPAAVGVSMALEPPQSRAGATARPALVAAIVGVIGVVGAVTLVRGIDDVLHRPERVGQNWDLEAEPTSGPGETTLQSIRTNLAANHDIDAFALISRAPVIVTGKGDVPLYSVQNLGGSIRFTVLEGRAPAADDELALGPRTASLLRAGVGDQIAVGPSSRPMKVVGVTLLAQTPHTSFDEGAWVTPAALDAITGTTWDAREGYIFVRVSGRASVDAVASQLNSSGFFVAHPSAPPDVREPCQRAQPSPVPGRLPRAARAGSGGPRPPAPAHARGSLARHRRVPRARHHAPRQAGGVRHAGKPPRSAHCPRHRHPARRRRRPAVVACARRLAVVRLRRPAGGAGAARDSARRVGSTGGSWHCGQPAVRAVDCERRRYSAPSSRHAGGPSQMPRWAVMRPSFSAWTRAS